MTWYCRVHQTFEGSDIGKLHDHLADDHPIEFASMEEFKTKVRKVLLEEIFEIQGPSRLTDAQVINRFHGRMPTLGLSVADNEREK